MTSTTLVQRPALVASWVTVTDISGRERTEMRWVEVPADEARQGNFRAA